MPTQAFTFFASNSKTQNWLSVVRIYPHLPTPTCVLNFTPTAPTALKTITRPGYVSGSLSFASDIQ